jgi:hypothetical protein
VFETQEQLNQRLDRAARARMRELFGTDDPAELAKFKAARENEEKAAKERMTREEQLTAELAAERQKAEKASAESARVQFEHSVSRACLELGAKNLDYALFLAAKDRASAPADQPFDVRAALEKRLSDATTKAAMGMEVAPAAPGTQPAPVTTVPEGGPPPAPPSGGNGAGFDAMKATTAEWAAHRERLGISI